MSANKKGGACSCAPSPQANVQALLDHFIPNATREGLSETPARYAKALQFWLSGYEQDPQAVLKVFEDGAEGYDEMITVGSIQFYSLCEHHLAPFFGVAHVGYIPNGKVVGLSKIPRLVEIFARRAQVQERLTVNVADALWKYLQPKAVGVVLRARHMCMESRGVQKPGALTYTSALRGLFKTEADARAEFLKFVERCDSNAGPI